MVNILQTLQFIKVTIHFLVAWTYVYKRTIQDQKKNWMFGQSRVAKEKNFLSLFSLLKPEPGNLKLLAPSKKIIFI